MRTEQVRRDNLIYKLQERNTDIINTIEGLRRDLTLNQQIIRELQREGRSLSSSEEDEISFENIKVEPKPKSAQKVKNNKKLERKEGYEKVRAWHLDRLRTKREDSKKKSEFKKMCITSMTTTQKDNSKASTTKENQGKKFNGGNSSLSGKIFDVSSRDAIHQFADTVKTIAGHVGQTYTHGGDIRFMIENLQVYQFIRPENPDNGDNMFEMESWKKQLDVYWKRRGINSDN
jgi:hypothetical protein